MAENPEWHGTWEDIGQVLKEYPAPIHWKFPPQQIHNPAWTNELNPYPGQWSVATEIIIVFVYSHVYMCVQMKGTYLGMIWNKGWKIPWVAQNVMIFHIYLCTQKWNC